MSALNNYRTEPLSPFYNKVKVRHSNEMYRLLAKHLPSNAKVLEVGPGHGHFANKMREVGLDYDAIEPSDYYRLNLQERKFSVTEEPVPPIKRDNEIYDLVYASMLIENLPSSYEAAEFANEAARVLKPNGVIALIFPNYLTWGRFFFDEHYTHSFETTPRRVAHLLNSQGFEVLQTEHTIGWFWIKGGLFKNILRHLMNISMYIVHTPLVRWMAEYSGFGEIHWKVSKTFFESIVMLARKK